jgi:hypothetical protein
MAQTLGRGTHIKNLENGCTNNNHTLASFEIKTVDGNSHPFWCAANDLPHLSAFLLCLCQFAAEKRGGLREPSIDAEVNEQATTAIGFGIGRGRTQDEMFFAIHIGIERPVVFAVSPNKLAELRDLLNRQLVQTQQPSKPN